MGRLLAIAIVIVGLAALTQSARPNFVYPAERTLVEARPIRGETRVGAFALVGAWRLSSPSTGFGGFSGLLVSGGEVLGVSDAGGTARFRVGSGIRWRADIQPISQTSEGPRRPALPGGDLEGATGSGGDWWVASEWRNAICGMSGGPRCLQPAAMAGWPRHFGPEALARLPDGRFLVLAEGDGESASPAVLFDRDPTFPGAVATRLRYTPPPGYRVTDAAALPDGRILLLHRRLAPLFESRITVLPGMPDPGRPIVRGRVLATIGAGPYRENYEGMAIDARDPSLLWLISDDNFAWYQSTKLLALRLPKQKGSAATALPFAK